MSVAKQIDFYTKGVASVEVNFPNDDVRCFNCEYCFTDNMKRERCRLMFDKLIFDANSRHEDCPIKFKEEENA